MDISCRFTDFLHNFQFLFLLIFILKLDKPFKDKELLNNLSFPIWWVEIETFWLMFCPLDPEMGIRILLQIQKANMFRIQRILCIAFED